MKKSIFILTGSLLLFVGISSANSTDGKTRPAKVEKKEVNVTPVNPVNSEKFKITKAEFEKLSPGKKDFVIKHPELFIISND